MQKIESYNFFDEIENVKKQVKNSIKATPLKVADGQRQSTCPEFNIFLGGDERSLDDSYEALKEISFEKGWKLERIGHREFTIDPIPNWHFLVCKK